MWCSHLVESVHDSQWGEWSMNDPTHWGMSQLVSNPRFEGKWDVFINLSGDSMPVFTPRIISQIFDPRTGPLRHKNFVTSSSCETGLIPTNVYWFPKGWHKREHYTSNSIQGTAINYIDELGDNKTVTMTTYFGSQWMALQPEFVHYIVEGLSRKNSLPSLYKKELIKTEKLMTDETFMPSILMNLSPFNETIPELLDDGSLKALPKMRSIRYERMDEHCPTSQGYFPQNQRYEVPESSRAEQPKTWGPYFLGIYDLANIKRSGALFIRKVCIYELVTYSFMFETYLFFFSGQ